jgi:hypothetical protein
LQGSLVECVSGEGGSYFKITTLYLELKRIR